MFNIYKIQNGISDYDCLRSAVVIATTEAEALSLIVDEFDAHSTLVDTVVTLIGTTDTAEYAYIVCADVLEG
jgi:hypothetical protein